MIDEDKIDNRANNRSEPTDEMNNAEEIERFAADRKAHLGTAKEWAELQDDLSILVDLRQTLENGIKGRSEMVVRPDDPEYQTLMTTHNLVSPGDSSIVHKKLVRGEWVVRT